jgi:hypothetical protein
MSALAARRAAQASQPHKDAPDVNGRHSASRPRAPSASSASSESASSNLEDIPDVQAGPSKRVRLSVGALKPRYYAAAPLENDVEHPIVSGPVRTAKRKRAYSPGAPVEEDSEGYGDSSGSGEESGDELPRTTVGNGPATTSAISTYKRCVRSTSGCECSSSVYRKVICWRLRISLQGAE